MGAPKQLGARRYALDVQHISRCRAGIVLDSGVDAETVSTALRQIDALIETLVSLMRQKEASDTGEYKVG